MWVCVGAMVTTGGTEPLDMLMWPVVEGVSTETFGERRCASPETAASFSEPGNEIFRMLECVSGLCGE